MLNFRNFQVGTKAKTATEIDTLQTCAPKHHGGNDDFTTSDFAPPEPPIFFK
jgi:hypothetical protein